MALKTKEGHKTRLIFLLLSEAAITKKTFFFLRHQIKENDMTHKNDHGTTCAFQLRLKSFDVCVITILA